VWQIRVLMIEPVVAWERQTTVSIGSGLAGALLAAGEAGAGCGAASAAAEAASVAAARRV
jgi:hypothetical protein